MALSRILIQAEMASERKMSLKKKTRYWWMPAAFVLSGILCFGCGSDKETVVLEGVSSETVLAAQEDGGESLGETEAAEASYENASTENTSLENFSEEAQAAVHVCGAVVRPGVYELPEGSRIIDAVEAAGGFAENASEDTLNLAREIEDGMKIQIPTKEEVMRAYEAASESGPGLPQWLEESSRQGREEEPSKININTATANELTELNGIGEARARDIIAYREENGPFQSIEEIKEVSGIKDAVFQKIKEEITVS